MLLCDILRINVDRDPDRVALVAGDRELSFGRLFKRSQRLANSLLGVAAPGDRIAILAENVPEYVDAYYGVHSAGMALTFLNYRLHQHEWAWILNNAQASVLLVEQSFLSAVEGLRAAVPAPQTVIVIGDAPPPGYMAYDEFVADASVDPPPVSLSGADVAWLIYTSGTTGFPKGAMLTHRNLTTSVLQSCIVLQPRAEDRELFAMPLCHVAGHGLLYAHLAGTTVVLMRAYEAETFIQLVERHKITVIGLAPAMINFILNHPQVGEYDLSTIRTIKYGASPMPLEVLRTTMNRFGPAAQALFGMTELAGTVTFLGKEEHVRAAAGADHLLASCGKPGPLCAVKVVDDAMTECAPGVVGEIVARGEQITSGYWANEDATKEANVGGWFHTGDMAFRDEEGFFYIVDRKKDMIVTGGENVYSKEVEDVLFEHEAVLEAAIIGLPDEKWGERVTAVVVLRPGASATEAEIITACKARLAGYKAPKTVFLADELPKNASGKVLKRQLRDTYTEAIPLSDLRDSSLVPTDRQPV